MIKKLFLCAALVGAVGLTSCVDDVESASVQAIRNAKAEQLKAAADLDKANAEAAIITANAQQKVAENGAATAAAQAELAKAEAALKQAQAAQIAAQTESDKAIAAAQVEKMMAEVERTKAEVAQLQAKLQMLIAQYEADIANYQLQAEQYRQQLEDLIAGRENAKLQGLVTDYNQALNTLKGYQDNLNSATFDLSKYEAGLMNATDVLQSQIETWRGDIENYRMQIVTDSTWIATAKSADYQIALERLPILTENKVALQAAKKEADLQKKNAENDRNSAEYKITDSDYYLASQQLPRSGSHSQYPQYQTGKLVPYLKIQLYNNSTNVSWPQNVNGNMFAEVNTLDAETGRTLTEYILLYTNASMTQKSVSYADQDNRQRPVYYYVYPKDYRALNVEGADNLSKKLNDNVKLLTTSASTAQKNLDDAKDLLTKLTDAKAKYDEADENNSGLADKNPPVTDPAEIAKRQAAYQTAKGNLVKFMHSIDENIPANKDDIAYAAVDNYYNNAKWTQQSNISTAENQKNYIDNTLAQATTYADEVNGYLATMKSGSTAFAGLLDAFNSASLTAAEKEAVYNTANAKYQINQAEINAYNSIINANNGNVESVESIKQQIASKESNIKYYQSQIANREANIAQYEKQIAEKDINTDKMVAELKAQIDIYKAQVASQQKVVDAAKAALDAALAAE